VNIMTTGKIKGMRDRGRQYEKILDSLIDWYRKGSTEILIFMTKGRLERHDRLR
jgi:hypothetical protein